MVDRDSHHSVFLNVGGSPVILIDLLGDVPGLIDNDLFDVRDLDGDLDIISLGDLGDHNVPLAGYFGAPGGGSAVGDAASAIGLALARAVRAAAVGAGAGFAGSDGVERNLNGVRLDVLSDLGIAGA